MIEGLDEKESTYIENMQEMFSTMGWQTLHEDVQNRLTLLKDQLLNTKLTSDEIRVAQGRADVMMEISNFQLFLENYVKAKQEPQESSLDE